MAKAADKRPESSHDALNNPPLASCSNPTTVPPELDESDLKKMYEGMVLVRAFDERILKLQRAGRIGFCVTGFGEEAAQIGSAAGLQDEDWLFPAYRQVGVLLYRGASLVKITDQLFGNAEDITKGRQMPVHYSFSDKRIVSISSVIGTQIVQGVGGAMTAQLKGEPWIAATYFGDGATSANDFHSGMNLAGARKAPVIFFCVNNQYAISLPIEKQTGCPEIYKKAQAYGMPGIRVDGNDVLAVYAATKAAADRARAGEGPTLIELFTYRVSAHSSSDDPSRYREQAETEDWKAKDPIARLQKVMDELGYWSESYEEKVWANARQQINDAIKQSEAKPHPTWESTFDDVYAEVPPQLARQRERLMAEESGLEMTNEGEFPL